MTNTALMERAPGAMVAQDDPQFWQVMQEVVTMGDLKNLSPEHKTKYYRYICQSVGLPPETLPFGYILAKGGAVKLYANRNATDQLRKIHHVDVTIIGRERMEDEKGNPMYCVTVRASTPDGRTDESIGVLPLTGLIGEDFCNALMKAETKAKRRATLSIVGLSIMDETEAQSIAGARMFAPSEFESPGFRLPATIPEPSAEDVDRRKAIAEPVPPARSNIHQHAQLRALADAGFPLSHRLGSLGLEHMEELDAEAAKGLILEGRASVRRPASASPSAPSIERVTPDTPFVASKDQVNLFWAAGSHTGWPQDEKRKVMAQLHPGLADQDGVVHLRSLDRQQFDDLIALFEERLELIYDAQGSPMLRQAGPPEPPAGDQSALGI